MADLLDGYDRSRIPLWIAAVVFGLALAYIIYSYIGTFVLGLFVYYITRPIHRRIATRIPQSNRRFVKRLPTASLAAGVSLLVIALPVILLVGYTVYVGVFQLVEFAESADLQPLVESLQPFLGTIDVSQNPQEVLTSLVEDLRRLLGGGAVAVLEDVLASVAAYLAVLGSALIHLFIVLAVAFYLLRDDHRIAAWFHAELADERTPVSVYLDAVDHNLKTIYFGNILNAFFTAILATISYNILNIISPAGIGVPVPTLLGLLTGVGSLIPVVGMKIVYIPVAIYLAIMAAITNPALLWFAIVFALVSLVIVDTIPDLVLRPYVSGRNLHTGAVMIAYIVGPLLFGWYGLFLGPLLLVLFVHFARIILPELIRGEPVTTQATAGNPLDPNDEIAILEPEPVDPTAGEAVETSDETDSGDDSDD